MRKLITILLSLLFLSYPALAELTFPSSSSSIPAFQGNQLINFSNPTLTFNGHKRIFVDGNSTVANPQAYYQEFCNILAASNVLSKVGLTPCTTGTTTNAVVGYQVLDSAGTIQVTFSPAAPSGYTIGELILSAPAGNNSALSNVTGSGVITAITTTTFTYTMVSPGTLPVAGAYQADTGFVTNSLLNLGYNGAASTAINTAVTPILATYAKPGDLVLVRGPIINDVRQGQCSLSCATANITTLYNSIKAAVPSNVDIAFKTENPPLLTDPGSTGYISAGSGIFTGLTLAQSSTLMGSILQQAVFSAFSKLPSYATVWDNGQLLYAKLGQQYSTSACMTDILHPAAPCQLKEADLDAEIITSIVNGNGIPLASKLLDPNASTATGTALLHGAVTWLEVLKTEVNYSPFLAARTFLDNYTTPWTQYPDVVFDSNKFDIVAYGTVYSVGTTFVRFSQPEPVGSSPILIKQNDLLWLEGSGVTQLPAGVASTAYNNGNATGPYGYGLTSTGTLPSTAFVGQRVAVFRQRSYNLADVGYLDDTATYPFRHRVIVTSSGTNFIRVKYEDGFTTWPSPITATDVLDLPCEWGVLTGATFNVYSTNQLQINLTGSWASCANQSGWIFSTKMPDITTSLVNSSGNIYAPSYISTGTTFTIASGCGTPTAFAGGATIGTFVAGQASCNPVINLPSAANGWNCDAKDLTNPSDTFVQTAVSTNSCTVSGTVTSGDTIFIKAFGY